eukprot:815281-Prorocentrum_minimum.AAC.1
MITSRVKFGLVPWANLRSGVGDSPVYVGTADRQDFTPRVIWQVIYAAKVNKWVRTAAHPCISGGGIGAIMNLAGYPGGGALTCALRARCASMSSRSFRSSSWPFFWRPVCNWGVGIVGRRLAPIGGGRHPGVQLLGAYASRKPLSMWILGYRFEDSYLDLNFSTATVDP